jgi:type VI secretion system protein ImpH
VVTASGTSDSSLEQAPKSERLYDEPYTFRFFQAVRLLQRLAAAREPVGRFVQPSNEAVRFGVHNILTFPPSEIFELVSDPPGPPKMSVNFMGLTGPLGVLPLYYTQLVQGRVKERDTTTRDFFDIFNHRMISLFYAAWEKYRAVVAYERGERDRATQALLSLIGLGTGGLPERQSVIDDALLFYAGLIGQRPLSASALCQVLSDYFQVPVDVEQFTGAWYALDRPTQCEFQEADTASEQLGYGAVVGDEVWNQQSRARLRIGPLDLERYLDFLPSGTAFEPLQTLTRLLVSDQIDFEVQLILKREDVPPCGLGVEEGTAPQLGWITWIKSAPLHADLDDTILPL